MRICLLKVDIYTMSTFLCTDVQMWSQVFKSNSTEHPRWHLFSCMCSSTKSAAGEYWVEADQFKDLSGMGTCQSNGEWVWGDRIQGGFVQIRAEEKVIWQWMELILWVNPDFHILTHEWHLVHFLRPCSHCWQISLVTQIGSWVSPR